MGHKPGNEGWVGDVSVPLPYRDVLQELLKRYMVPARAFYIAGHETHSTYHMFAEPDNARSMAKAFKRYTVPFYMFLRDGEQCYGLFDRHDRYVQGGWLPVSKPMEVDWQKQIDIHKQQQVVHLLSK